MNYVGIDHHRQYSHMTLMDQEGRVLRSGRVPKKDRRYREGRGEAERPKRKNKKVKSLFANDDFSKPFQISVETYKVIVQLSGLVNSQQAVDKAG
jgi:osmotically-inducible protein OsmY